jgi:hypothetical protein
MENKNEINEYLKIKILTVLFIKENYYCLLYNNLTNDCMKNYTSLSSSPTTNYMQFNNDMQKQQPYQSQQYVKNQNGNQNDKHNDKHNDHNLYTSEDIINVNKPFFNNLHNQELQSIVLPFYIPIIDIVISNDLAIEIVDHSSIETRERILCKGRIRKYRLNDIIKNYDIFIEMENENVFHVKRRGIMMRTRVSEDLRRHIIKTMVNYVADGGDVDRKVISSSSSSSSSSSFGGSISRGSEQDIHASLLRQHGNTKPKKGCFSFLSCFRATHD